ncbi:hypothetical protein B0H16DRAFT_1479798 [Mycena metata]|uniref:Uncharacterized protein n=1 Tax=Mycena metata TaxID=1033252 RepID=A0AAD7MDZ6_9AGAR|nr:hypothetical protein B0H16DRAFT_1479798 [Mycena metata]
MPVTVAPSVPFFRIMLSLMRRKLLQDYSVSDTLDELFNRLETFPKPSLLVLAQSHGLKTIKVGTSEQLRASICHHVALGSCTTREGYASYLACSSVEAQISSPVLTPGTGDYPATCLQIHTLRQIAPLLHAKPLKRLLHMHDVYFCETDNCKQLRKRLKSFLRTLITGKYGENALPDWLCSQSSLLKIVVSEDHEILCRVVGRQQPKDRDKAVAYFLSNRRAATDPTVTMTDQRIGNATESPLPVTVASLQLGTVYLIGINLLLYHLVQILTSSILGLPRTSNLIRDQRSSNRVNQSIDRFNGASVKRYDEET